ncbi:methionine ABC transporter permease [Clostridium oryzae]|uniref:Methionine import system permease protein MetP n=1 Tax=Clostridium oryzae TaxID=1450648 RepID=A0A1V4IUF4_9CLOT|nr:methionine ABC transporter permease [Clostridium oryzae]OPJ63549.1 methionine import system permease protein MetP [Clostridium oryzae]
MSDNTMYIVIKQALGETIYMSVVTSVFTFLLGTIFGVILVVTEKGNILQARGFNKVFGTVINIVRSFPTMILIVVLLPLSRLIVGTTIGANAAIVPLVIGIAPFLGRMVENNIKEVEHGKIEAAVSMGTKAIIIITRVLIPEALPSLIRSYTICIITVIGSTTLAGAIGAGGLGSVALRYGYERFETSYMIVTVIILIALVQIIQILGDIAAKLIIRKRFKFN